MDGNIKHATQEHIGDSLLNVVDNKENILVNSYVSMSKKSKSTKCSSFGKLFQTVEFLVLEIFAL